MSRYINKDKLIEALSIFNDKEHGNPNFLNGIKTAAEVAENISIVDLEEVIHCRDCKHKGEYRCRNTNMYVGNNDYCSFAERKKEE
jgi:hypothetical protein